MTADNYASICMKHGVKVYPVAVSKNLWQIEYSENGVVKKRFEKELSKQKEIDEAIKKTYEFIAKKLIIA